MSNNNNLLEQLALLREVTKTTGALHDAQVFQLKGYILGTFLAKKVQLHFDWENKKVTFNVLILEENANLTNFNRRLELLNRCVKVLLGEEYQAIVDINPDALRKPNVRRKQAPRKRPSNKRKQRARRVVKK